MSDVSEPNEPIDPDVLDARIAEANELLSKRWTWGHARGLAFADPPLTFAIEEIKTIVADAIVRRVNPVDAARAAINAKNEAMTLAHRGPLN